MITIIFADRQPVASANSLGVEGDNKITKIKFVPPALFAGQAAYALYEDADGATGTVLLGSDGIWTIGRGITRAPGTLSVRLRVVSASDEVWNSHAVKLKIKDVFDVSGNAPPADDPTALESALATMSGYAVRAETAKTSADTAKAAAVVAQTGAKAAQTGAEAAQAGTKAIADSILGAQANALTLAAGSAATAETSVVGGKLVIALGIPKGAQGIKGDTGAQGAQGIKGDTGAQGVQGIKGDTGAQGIQGVKGDTGAQGIQGAKGDTGTPGMPICAMTRAEYDALGVPDGNTLYVITG
ncbi:MAG: hypothetical protein RR739_04190, partial [Clostridia bacterium]